MSVLIANVTTSDTFQIWLDKTNQALNNISTVVVTTAANSTGGATSGNAYVNGTLSSNTIAITQALRGGTVATAANLAITSNVVFSGANVGGSVTHVNFTSSNVFINSTSTTVAGGDLVVTSNLNVKNNTIFTSLTGCVGINTGSPDSTITINGTANVSGNAKFLSITTFTANALFQGNAYISVAGAPTTGYLFFGNTTTRSLGYDGSQYVFTTANLQVQGTLLTSTINAAANVSLGSGPGSGVFVVGDITGNSNTCSRTVTAGNWLSGGGQLNDNITLNVVANNTSVANTVVLRDASGNFAANNITANVDGTSARSNNIFFSGGTYPGALNASGSTVALRDGTGSLTVNILYGTSTTARYADLAEKYLADREYPVGTVIMVGGEEEVTAATRVEYQSIIGVVSANPAYLMNSDLEGGTAIALKGRVPVRVLGAVKKGQPLGMSPKSGVAMVDYTARFAVALETRIEDIEGLIEAVIL